MRVHASLLLLSLGLFLLASCSSSEDDADDGPVSDGGAEVDPNTQVSFKEDIAPILISRCGGCHIKKSKGELSMVSFDSLMKGSENGPVVQAGEPDESRLIELVKVGEMPPKSKTIYNTDLSWLKLWISQGAKFDGDSTDQELVALAPDVEMGGGDGEGDPDGDVAGGGGQGGRGGGRGGGPGGEGGRGGGQGGGRGGFDPAAFFDERDKDGDGQLGGDEISERMQENIADTDKDGDGKISKDEFIERMRSIFAGGRGGGEGGRGGRGGGEGGRGGERGGGSGGGSGRPQRPPIED